MEVSESGNITTNIVSGSLNAYVDRGGIFASIESLTDDSVLKVKFIKLKSRNFEFIVNHPRNIFMENLYLNVVNTPGK